MTNLAPGPEESVPNDDLVAVSTAILETALAEFGCDNCVLYLFNPATGAFLSPPHTAGKFRKPFQFAAPRPQGITQDTLAERYLVVNNVAATGRYQSSFTEREQIRSFMAVRLMMPARRHPFAVLYLNYVAQRTFLPPDTEKLVRFGDRSAAELQTAWSFIRYKNVVQIGNAINQNLTTVPDLFKQLLEQVSGTIDTEYSFMLGVIDRTGLTVDLHHRLDGERGTRIGLRLYDACRAALEANKVVRSPNDPLDDFGFPLGGRAQSNVFVPLSLRTTPVGFLLVQHIAQDIYDDEDVRILEILGNHVATALNGIELFQSLDLLQSVGQVLTTDLQIDDIEFAVAERIQAATKADLVVLFSYDSVERRFDPPRPLVIGELLDRTVPLPSSYEIGDVPTSTIELREPVFAPDASKLGSEIAAKLGRTVLRTESLFQKREQVASAVAVPLRIAGVTVGALYLNYRQPQTFAGPQTRVIRGLSVFSAIAINNARLYSKRGEQHSRKLAAIRLIDQQLNQSRSLSDVLHAIVSGANDIVKADRASLLLLVDGKLRVATSVGKTPHEINRPLNVDSPKGISAWAFRQGQPAVANNVRNDPFWSTLFIDTGDGMESELDHPLIDNESVIGVLNFESSDPRHFNAEHAEFVDTLAGQVVIAVKKAQAYEDAMRRAHEHQRLIGFTTAVVGKLQREEILEQTLTHAKDAARVEAGIIFLYDDESDELEAKISHGFPHVDQLPRLKRNRGLIGGQSARSRMTIAVNPRKSVATTDEERDFLADFPSVLIAPMHDGTSLWGVLLLAGHGETTFDDGTQRVVRAIASAAAMAFQSSDRYHEATERRRQMRTLLELSQKTIAEAKDPNDVLRAVVRSALELTRATRSDLDLHDSNEELVRTLYCNREESGLATPITEIDLVKARPADLKRGIMAKVARDKEGYRALGDAYKDEWYQGKPGIHSEVAVPLVGHERKLIGVLNVESTDFNAFDDDDKELLQLFADEAVLAMEITSSQNLARRELQRFNALLDAGEALSALSGSQRLEASSIVVREAAEQCSCFAVVRAYDFAANEFRLVAKAGEGAEPFPSIPITDSVYAQVFKDRWEDVMIEDLQYPPYEYGPISLSDKSSRSLMVAPVFINNTIYGSIGMSHPRPRYFAEPDRKLIRGLARLLAVTLQRMDSAERETELLERNKNAAIMVSMGDAALDLAHRLGEGLGGVDSRIDFARMDLDRGDRLAAEAHLKAVTTSVSRVIAFGQQLRDNVKAVTSSDPAPFSLADIVNDIDKLAAPLGYEVINEITPDTPRIYAAANDVRLILQNLADNAVAAMNGSGRIWLRARSNGHMVEIEFADDGPGVPVRERPHIFRLGVSSKESSGWGLFSARSKAIINRGDLILADSERGARFVLTLPRAEVEVTYGNRRDASDLAH
ncbi:MAG TPA: GAF domain-containing protein [Thermoanaerobaculia bacterium]|nr:GAF domain-containing protein [Thermoanaerobaculia bacterium]